MSGSIWSVKASGSASAFFYANEGAALQATKRAVQEMCSEGEEIRIVSWREDSLILAVGDGKRSATCLRHNVIG